MLKFEKFSILWHTKFQQVIVKYHEVEALFCKMSCHVENLAQMQCLYTQNANTRSVLGTDPVLKIGPTLQHLYGYNSNIPNSRELVDPSF